MPRTNMRRLSSWWRTGMGSDDSVSSGAYGEQLQPVVIADDLKAPPHVCSLGPTETFTFAASNAQALILAVPSNSGGVWVDFAFASSSAGLSKQWYDVQVDNPWVTELTELPHRTLGEVASVASIWNGQLNGGVQSGISMYRGQLSGGGPIEGPVPGLFPLFVPAGNHFWVETAAGTVLSGYGIKWRDV